MSVFYLDSPPWDWYLLLVPFYFIPWTSTSILDILFNFSHLPSPNEIYCPTSFGGTLTRTILGHHFLRFLYRKVTSLVGSHIFFFVCHPVHRPRTTWHPLSRYSLSFSLTFPGLVRPGGHDATKSKDLLETLLDTIPNVNKVGPRVLVSCLYSVNHEDQTSS